MKPKNALLPQKEELKKRRRLRDIRKAWLSLILSNGPYDHFATFTTAIDCSQSQAWEAMEFLLYLANTDAFGRRFKNKPDSEQKSLAGYVFAETQGYGNLHFHFLFKSNPYITSVIDLLTPIVWSFDKPTYTVKIPRIYPRYLKEIEARGLSSTEEVMKSDIGKDLRTAGNGIKNPVFGWQGFDLQTITSQDDLCDYLTKTLDYHHVPAKELTIPTENKKNNGDPDDYPVNENHTEANSKIKPTHEKLLILPPINADFICEFNKDGINNKPVRKI